MTTACRTMPCVIFPRQGLVAASMRWLRNARPHLNGHVWQVRFELVPIKARPIAFLLGADGTKV